MLKLANALGYGYLFDGKLIPMSNFLFDYVRNKQMDHSTYIRLGYVLKMTLCNDNEIQTFKFVVDQTPV